MYMDEAKDKRRGIYMLIFVLLIIGGTIGIHILVLNANSVGLSIYKIYNFSMNQV